MSQIERGGTNLGRWPADVGNVSDEPDAAIEEVGTDEADRLSELPDHEIDRDTSMGAGLTASGATAEDRGVDSIAGAEADELDDPDDPNDVGLPLSGDVRDR